MTHPLGHRLKAVFLILALLLIVMPAAAVARNAGAGHMYATADKAAVQLRLLTDDALRSGSITFDAKCSGGDITVKIRRGRISHRGGADGYGVKIAGTVSRRAFTGTITSWGPDCSLSRRFSARRHY